MPEAPIFIRPFVTGFALVQGLLAASTIAAELMRPSPVSLPASAVEAKVTASQSSAAAAAAWLGWPRGELWGDYAVATNSELVSFESGSVLSRTDDHAKRITEIAARLAPSDARSWLLLAMNAVAASNDVDALALLKMSYYTSPYSDALFPLRIQIAAQTPNIADEELSSYVEYELAVVVGKKSNLKKFIVPAYRTGSTAGRRFLESALAKLDPSYLAVIKSSNP